MSSDNEKVWWLVGGVVLGAGGAAALTAALAYQRQNEARVELGRAAAFATNAVRNVDYNGDTAFNGLADAWRQFGRAEAKLSGPKSSAAAHEVEAALEDVRKAHAELRHHFTPGSPLPPPGGTHRATPVGPGIGGSPGIVPPTLNVGALASLGQAISGKVATSTQTARVGAPAGIWAGTAPTYEVSF